MSATAGGRIPAAFFGHGSPMNVLERNRYTRAWEAFGATLSGVRAILAISAHWYVPGSRVTAGELATVHDFNGTFPNELFAYRYPARSDDALVERIIDLLDGTGVRRDSTWGLDHGAYGVLAHMFSPCVVPVVQLSIDRSKPPRDHYELAARLRPLRDEGVFVFGSGNVVHNLELAQRGPAAAPYDWARRYESYVRERLEARDHDRLVEYRDGTPDAVRSVPTPEHYLPLLYAVALQHDGEPVSVLSEGIEGRSISMLSVRIGT